MRRVSQAVAGATLLAMLVLASTVIASHGGQHCSGTCNGGNGSNWIIGSPERDQIDARGGNDIVEGRGDRDTLKGGENSDLLLGQKGKDEVRGQSGFDGGSCGGLPCGVEGGNNDDDVYGMAGGDILFGGSGIDLMVGGDGNDDLFARDGQVDVINGGPGFDVCEVDNFDISDSCGRV